jgi:hypothetical protein
MTCNFLYMYANLPFLKKYMCICMCENNECKFEGNCSWKGSDSYYHING